MSTAWAGTEIKVAKRHWSQAHFFCLQFYLLLTEVALKLSAEVPLPLHTRHRKDVNRHLYYIK